MDLEAVLTGAGGSPRYWVAKACWLITETVKSETGAIEDTVLPFSRQGLMARLHWGLLGSVLQHRHLCASLVKDQHELEKLGEEPHLAVSRSTVTLPTNARFQLTLYSNAIPEAAPPKV